MKNLLLKTIAVIVFCVNQLVLAQSDPNPPMPTSDPTGGSGGVGPGSRPKNPIDMYEYILVIAAIFLIIYFYKRSKKLKLS